MVSNYTVWTSGLSNEEFKQKQVEGSIRALLFDAWSDNWVGRISILKRSDLKLLYQWIFLIQRLRYHIMLHKKNAKKYLIFFVMYAKHLLISLFHVNILFFEEVFT